MQKRKKRSSKDFKIIVFIVIVICLCIIGRQEYNIYQIKKEEEATQQRISELQQKKAQLEAERKRLDDPKYIEKLARDDYNMVGKNEVPLFIVDKDKDKDKDKNQNDGK